MLPLVCAKATNEAVRAPPAGTYHFGAVEEVRAYVVEARLVLEDGSDPAAAGAAVTIGLCGHWEHEGACRWPHNNAVDADSTPARFRTLFVASSDEEAHVRQRIESALRAGRGWQVLSTATRPVAEGEQALARRLLSTRSSQT